MISVVQCRLSDYTTNLNFAYDQKRNHKQTLELGNLIKTVEPSILGDILVFFPSYD